MTGQNNFAQYITEFYSRLYSSDVHTFGTMEAQAECWTSVLVKVTQDTNTNLTRALIVATLALGSRPRQRACKGVSQKEARESKQTHCKGVGQEEAGESHHILPRV